MSSSPAFLGLSLIHIYGVVGQDEVVRPERLVPIVFHPAQFLKGMEQIAQEGAIQIFKTPYSGMEEVIVGVVGTLQFDVLDYRLKNEYGVDLYVEGLPYEYLRWRCV